MADRYWRGGTASWDGTAGSKWADTVGGAAGAAVPTSADDVYFDATSGANTVTIATGNTGAKSINCTGFTGTLAGSAAITVSGSVTLVAGMTVTYSGTLTLNATGTLTTAGKTIGPVTVDATGGTVTLGDALTSSGAITVTNGTFTTANFNVTATQLSSSNSNTRTINLGSSTVALSSTAAALNFATSTNLTFKAGTSQINCTASVFNFAGGSKTFYNVSFTSTTAGTRSITGANTFNNLSVTGPSSAEVVPVPFDSPQTINGQFSTSGTAGNQRVWFRSATYGLQQTLICNGTTSLTDADFRDIIVFGTASPITGTRIGDLRGCSGITFSTPKTVYWNQAAGGNWSGNNWAASSGAGVSTDNFPLAQDTAIIENTGLNTSATVTLDAAIPYTGSLTTATRSNAMAFAGSTFYTFYGDFTLSSVVSFNNTNGLAFSGQNTQTITSAGKNLQLSLTVDSYGGTVQLGDALDTASSIIITNGTFDTKNFNVTATLISSSNTNVRTITLGSSTVTLVNSVNFSNSRNLTFNAGTSTIILTTAGASISGGNSIFYDVSFTSTAANTHDINDSNTFNNLSITAPASAGLRQITFNANQTITGTFTCAGATAVRRIFVRSNTLGTTRTLTVGTLSATDCDFRDITIAGGAAGSSPTRAGDCGGNTGITFPAPKTVYWNLAGAQNWSATAWCPSTGGTPDINQFPLAQDTAKFDEAAGSVTGTITIDQAWNIGTFDASARTSAMTLTNGTNQPVVYGDWKFGTGVTSSNTGGAYFFSKRGTATITSNGVNFGCDVRAVCFGGTLQLADAFSMASNRLLYLTSGTFDAVSYNVTIGYFLNNSTPSTLKMGSGTWSLVGGGTATIWDISSNVVFYKNTANIVLTNTNGSLLIFTGGGLSYNKLTIGGTTGTNTLTINGNNQFTELASTKTVAHTIALGSTTQTFGVWSVTGTAGNVVTVTGTGTSHVIAGAATSGLDYLAMGTIGFSATSPGEFYAGVNSTGTGTGVILTAPPTPRTLYWVAGTGNWNDTAHWSTTSGSGSGAAVPTSLDDVIFDSGSNATAYTSTVNATTRFKTLTIAGPASGNVTLAGSSALIAHGNIVLPASGLTRTYTGTITLSGSTGSKTLTTNGVTLNSAITVNGVNCGWALADALNNGTSTITVTNGSFDLATYNLTAGNLNSDSNTNSRTIIFGSGTATFDNLYFGTNENTRANLICTANTSQINISAVSYVFQGNNQTFYNVSFTNTAAGSPQISGANTFNNLTFAGLTSAGLKQISLSANQTVTGTLTFSAGTNAAMRHFVYSNTFGTTRTITAAAFSGTDVDFRDITIAGAAAPVSGTRLGDCKGNSGITFDAPKTVYCRATTSDNWSATTTWAATNGGSSDITYFPLAQDTAIFPSSPTPYPNSAATITVNAGYNIGTIDMSARTTNTMTLATGSTTPTIYGNWINGTGTTLTGTGTLTFAGRGSQTITSAGITFTQGFTVDALTGSVTLQDAFTSNRSTTGALTITSGTFDAATYNLTLSGSSATVSSSNSNTRTIAMGSGTWTIAGSGTSWNLATSTNLTITGTGTIKLTSASAKTFDGGGLAYTNITLDNGGAGALTINGSNTFKNITSTASNTYTTSINFGASTTQTVTAFSASGQSGRRLTLTGTSAANPATLRLTGGVNPSLDYVTLNFIRAYPLTSTWNVGSVWTNGGTLGFVFGTPYVPTSTNNFLFFFPQ